MDASGYLVRYKSNRNSHYAIFITAVIHVVIILLALNLNVNKRAAYSRSSLQMLELQQKKPVSELMPELPLNNLSPNAIHLTVPNVEFTEYNELASDSLEITAPYEFPDKNSEQHQNVFDPKLRKKLLDVQSLNRPRAGEKAKSWSEIDGRVFIEVGGGLCEVSMTNADTHSKAANWGMTTCGKTDSEKTMGRVMADYESHKLHP
jgi:hypothetical protein